MVDYKSYLAANILSEDKVITYRLLSRALKIHVNAAKEMLYEFHTTQNAKKPGSIHATYLISGTKRPEEPTNVRTKDGEDEYMQSSPFMASNSMSQPDGGTGASSYLTITLTPEESLEKTKSEYDHISSIHIFSLGPNPLRELQLLSDCTRELQTLTAAEDPLIHNPTYGTILNPLCKRRPARRPPPAAAPAPFVPQLKASAPLGKEVSKPVKAEPKVGAAANDFFGKSGKENPPKASGGKSSKESTPAPEKPGLKRENSSLFKAFAKGKPKEKKEEVEDVSMRDMSDDEEETYIPPVQEKKESEGDRKSRKEREKALREMMEQDDDEDEAVPSPVPEPEEEETVLEKVKEEEEPEPVVTISGGRRRGKRRVMKKKTIQDSEGYLVTKEEAAWESFSEDEPVAPPPKPKFQASTTAKAKKAEKKGQGSIMSFFGKK